MLRLLAVIHAEGDEAAPKQTHDGGGHDHASPVGKDTRALAGLRRDLGFTTWALNHLRLRAKKGSLAVTHPGSHKRCDDDLGVERSGDAGMRVGFALLLSIFPAPSPRPLHSSKNTTFCHINLNFVGFKINVEHCVFPIYSLTLTAIFLVSSRELGILSSPSHMALLGGGTLDASLRPGGGV